MKQLGVFLLPPGWVASASQGYPHIIKFSSTHLYTWVVEGIVSSQSKVSCPRAKHNVPGQGSNVDRLPWNRAH